MVRMVRMQVRNGTNGTYGGKNEASLKKGKIFYEENKQYFERAEKETGVATSDIIAILNWESRLGKYKGEYDVFKIFINQYFHIDEIEFELFQAGQYKNDGAMGRTAALKRIKKIKKRAVVPNSVAPFQAIFKESGVQDGPQN